MNFLMCPVCLAPITERASKRGVVQRHLDTCGRICPMSGQPIPQWDERSTREAVRGRSGGICEFCSQAQATEMHHRQSRGVGGKWHPANMLHLCHFCHREVTENPAWARAQGLIVQSHQDPERVAAYSKTGMLLACSDRVTSRRWT